MRSTGRYAAIGLLLLIAAALLAMTACRQAATPTPSPTPVLTPMPTPPPTPTPVPTLTPSPTPRPTPTPSPTPPPPIGMGIGERFHDIHTQKLQLKCETCHSNAVGTYYDPLAQVSNLADRRACLSCHKEEAIQPFYGEAWGKAKVRR